MFRLYKRRTKRKISYIGRIQKRRRNKQYMRAVGVIVVLVGALVIFRQTNPTQSSTALEQQKTDQTTDVSSTATVVPTPTPSAVAKTPTPTPKQKVDNEDAAVLATSLFVLPDSNPKRALAGLSGDQQQKISRIANTPFGLWQTKSSSLSTYNSTVEQAFAAQKVPIIVLYNIPNIGCGSSGAAGLEAYKTWINERASALSGQQSIVILEPDALSLYSCLTTTQQTTRIAALTYAIDEFSKTKAVVYIDAGHSKWVDDDVMAERLKLLPLGKVQGISINVSNYQTDTDSESYAKSVIKKTGFNLHYVIDTSRNGVGSPADNNWCNAPGRRLGRSSAVVQSGNLDAYLWIKVPGESDGTCQGGPSEGAWWLEYALELAS